MLHRDVTHFNSKLQHYSVAWVDWRAHSLRRPHINSSTSVWEIEGVRTDPVTYLMYNLPIKFEHFEDERQLQSGTELIDFHALPGERIDATLARFEVARLEAASAGLDVPNFQLLTTVLFRALHISSGRALHQLQPPQN